MDSENHGLRAQILQTTLNEVSSRRQIGDEEAETENPCVICLDRISEPTIARPCNHDSFDYLCLLSWLEQQPNCPLCKSSITEIQYDFRSNKYHQTYKVLPQKTRPGSSSATYSRPNLYHTRTRRPQQSRRYHEPRPTPDEAILRRRRVYQNHLYSLHVGSNRVSQFQVLTPQLFTSNPTLVTRARKWIRRELQVFSFLHPSSTTSPEKTTAGADRRSNNAEFLLEYIIAILKTVDIQGSQGEAEEMLQEFIGRENTRLFLHELRAWLRSPYTELDDWDRHVQYDESKLRAGDGFEGGVRSRRVDSYRPVRRFEPYARAGSSRSASEARASTRYKPD
jgi:hypothetical protein